MAAKKIVTVPDSEKVLSNEDGLAVWIHQNVDGGTITLEFESNDLNVSMFLNTEAARTLTRAINKHAQYSESRSQKELGN